MNRIVYTIGGFILMGISEIFKYYHLSRIFGKTGDLIGVVGLIAAVYGLWPIVKIFLALIGIRDNDSSSSNGTNWLEKLRKNAEEAKIREEKEKEKKQREETERKGRELNEEIRKEREKN